MPRFTANISTLFQEHAPLGRLGAARKAGFRAVEIQFPYDIPLDDWLVEKRRQRMRFILINIPAGDLITGGPGLAAMPGREAAFREAVAECARYAKALSVDCVNVLAGAPPAELERARCMETLVGNLRHAAGVMSEIGIRVVVEPINTVSLPGFLLADSAEALQAIDWAGHVNLALQYDLFHAQIMEGDLVRTIERILPRIGHMQFADVPDRHEPGTGEINFDHVFPAIDRLGYEGWIGAEYLPSTATEDTLGWFEPWRKSQG